MRSNIFLAFALSMLTLVGACSNAAKPPVIAQQTPVPVSPATASPAHTDDGHDAPRISLADAKKEYDAGTAVIVDVRDPSAYKFEHIKDSLNIPLASIDASINKIPKGKKIIAYCSWRDEHTSASWVAEIKKKGIENAYALLGGTQAWKDAGYPMGKQQ